MCKALKEALDKKPFFDCIGGCGVDTSNGENPCMASAGIWFKYCPFCGKKIIYTRTKSSWEWHEEGPAADIEYVYIKDYPIENLNGIKLIKSEIINRYEWCGTNIAVFKNGMHIPTKYLSDTPKETIKSIKISFNNDSKGIAY